MAASPDGRRIALSTHDGRILTCLVPAGEITRVIAPREIDSTTGDMSGLVFSPDSRWLAWSASGPGPWEDPGPRPLRQSSRRPQPRPGRPRDVAPVHRHEPGVHARRQAPRVPVHPQSRPGLRHVLLRPVLPGRLPTPPGCPDRRHPSPSTRSSAVIHPSHPSRRRLLRKRLPRQHRPRIRLPRRSPTQLVYDPLHRGPPSTSMVWSITSWPCRWRLGATRAWRPPNMASSGCVNRCAASSGTTGQRSTRSLSGHELNASTCARRRFPPWWKRPSGSRSPGTAAGCWSSTRTA